MTRPKANAHHVARAHDFHQRWVQKFFGIETPMHTDHVVEFCQFLAAELVAVERETARAASRIVEHALMRHDTNGRGKYDYCAECDTSWNAKNKPRHSSDCIVKLALSATCQSKATPQAREGDP